MYVCALCDNLYVVFMAPLIMPEPSRQIIVV